ncbi:hypothetical protein COLO4_37794 [Corchorus olitorius]|uniref:Uncharacterized protein n=1 Tax=Corchorus olitorius TaxID=93759 RepID=A0A1R3FZ76_9ROSI|nr:hypothetical protein COLO4_37794 [Corchorus olitorius]
MWSNPQELGRTHDLWWFGDEFWVVLVAVMGGGSSLSRA